jgi:3-dehydroquinate synthase
MGVVLGPQLLKSLPRREVSSGLAEVVKYGVLEGGALLERLERDAEDLVANPETHGTLYAECCAIKSRVVAADERERGQRALLNLGHTFGHAIESMADQGSVTHGEAVSMGMIMAAHAAEILGLSDGGWIQRLETLLSRLGLPVDGTPWLARTETMVEHMCRDKKSSGDSVRMVLPLRPGDVLIQSVEKGRLPGLLKEIARRSGRGYSEEDVTGEIS